MVAKSPLGSKVYVFMNLAAQLTATVNSAETEKVKRLPELERQ